MSGETETYRSAIIAHVRRMLQHGQPSQTEREAIVRELAAGEEQVNISRLEEIIAPKGLWSMRSIEAAASSLWVQPAVVAVRTTADIEPAGQSPTLAPAWRFAQHQGRAVQFAWVIDSNCEVSNPRYGDLRIRLGQ